MFELFNCSRKWWIRAHVKYLGSLLTCIVDGAVLVSVGSSEQLHQVLPAPHVSYPCTKLVQVEASIPIVVEILEYLLEVRDVLRGKVHSYRGKGCLLELLVVLELLQRIYIYLVQLLPGDLGRTECSLNVIVTYPLVLE